MTRAEFERSYQLARVLYRETIAADRARDKARSATAERAWGDFAQPGPRAGVRLVGRRSEVFHPAAFARMTRDDRVWFASSAVLSGRRIGLPSDRWLLEELRTRAVKRGGR